MRVGLCSLLGWVLLSPIVAAGQTATVTATPNVTPTSSASPTEVEPTPTASTTDTPEPPTRTETATRTLTGTVTRTSTRTASRTQTPTPTETASRTQTVTRTVTETETSTPTDTPTEIATPTRTRTATRTPTGTSTRTGTRTPTRTGTRTPTRTSTPTRTQTGTRTVTATRTQTGTPTQSGTPTDTPSVTPTPTPPAASISVGRFADTRGDNLDGTFTTVVTAFAADRFGNPVGDDTTVTFSLVDFPPGVVIEFSGRTNRRPNCDLRAFEADTGLEVVPQPGRAFSCLRYLESVEGEIIRVRASVPAAEGIIDETRSVRLPTGPTPTPTSTPTATETFTASPTETVTPTSTSTPTVTVTETPSVDTRLVAAGNVVRPGEVATVDVGLVDLPSIVVELQFDLLFEQAVFDLTSIEQKCLIDPRLKLHSLFVSVAFDPNVPPGQRRFRYVFFDPSGNPPALRTGPLVRCLLPVLANAPAGASMVRLDQVLASDADGNLIGGVLSVHGEVLIDPDLPTPTPTSTSTPSLTPTNTPTPSPTSTVTETATPTETPTHTSTPEPTPTPTPRPCVGDCDGNGQVAVNELVIGVGIAGATSALDICPAYDADDSGSVSIDELVTAVGNGIRGCGGLE